MCVTIHIGTMDHPLAFLGRDTHQRWFGIRRTTCAHLHEDPGLALSSDNVNLPADAVPIGLDNGVVLRL